MFDEKRKKTICLGILTILLLTGILAIFLTHVDKNVFHILADTGPSMILVLLLYSLLYIFMDAMLYKAVFSHKTEAFAFGNGLALSNLRTFGKTVLIVGGSMPIQSYYLYKKGLALGRSVGITTALYVMQKVSIFLYTTVLLCFQWDWVSRAVPSLPGLLIFSYIVCALIILVMFLLCTSVHVCRGALRLVGKLPDSGKWPERKTRWSTQISALYEETHVMLKARGKCFAVLIFDCTKLFIFFTAPFVIVRMLGDSSCSLMQIQVLCALMLFFSHALPNVGGMGSVEFSFMLVFSGSLGAYTAATMIYYRCATYYFPFIMSVIAVFVIQRKLSAPASSPQIP